MIRLAAATDVAVMRAIEAEAGEMFRAIDMADVADETPSALRFFRAHVLEERAWVAEEEAVVAFALARPLGSMALVEQVSVRPTHQRRRIGAALLDTISEWAAMEGLDSVVVTTFRDVAWNAPYYERLGFVALHEQELAPLLGALLRDEAAHLPSYSRLAMGRHVRTRSPTVRRPAK